MQVEVASGVGLGLLVTALGFGLRHGIDWDHIAAITDLTSGHESRRKGMVSASLYAVGHAVVVLILGGIAIAAGGLLPDAVDTAMERLVGVTLVLLGTYVFVALIRHGRSFRMRSRWMLVMSGAARAVRWLRDRFARADDASLVEVEHDHDHDDEHHPVDPPPISAPITAMRSALAVETRHSHAHRHVGALPDDPFATPGPVAALAIGMIHGVGVETPTQILLFVTAAQVTGTLGGFALLGAFVAGLLATNTATALVATRGYLSAQRSFRVYASVAVITGAFSLGLGLMYLFGAGSALPALVAG